MSATFTILSPLDPKRMIDVENAVEVALEQYLEDHPDCDDDWGQMGPGGLLPSLDEVRAAYARYGLTLEQDVLARFQRCRSAFTIDRPGDIEVAGGLQVSLLRFLLEEIGESLVLLNDYPFETSEALLTRLKKRRSAPGFGKSSAPKRRPVARRDEKPGELRAIGILRLLERAMSDVRVAIDVKAALAKVSASAQRYAVFLLEEGAESDAKAAKALGMTKAELLEVAEELETALRRR